MAESRSQSMRNIFSSVSNKNPAPRIMAEQDSFALLLTNLDESLNVDRQLLRQALRQSGIRRFRTMSAARPVLAAMAGHVGFETKANAASAASNLPDYPPSLIICTEKMSDMDCATFLRAIAAIAGSAAGALPSPVLVIADSDARSEEKNPAPSPLARFAALGATAVLSRPYSLEALESAVARVVESAGEKPCARIETAAKTPEANQDRADGLLFLKPAAQTAKTADATEIAASKTEPALIQPLLRTRKGLAALRAGHLDLAERLLRQGLDYDSLDLDACQGLATIASSRGNDETRRRWLNRAGLICLRTGQNDRAETFFTSLAALDADNDAPRPVLGSPYLSEALSLIEEEACPQACEILLEHCARERDEPLHMLMARVCQFSRAPEQALIGLCAALENKGQAVTARNIRRRLLDDAASDPAGDSFLSRFPLLQEAWAVARFTMRAWRNAA